MGGMCFKANDHSAEPPKDNNRGKTNNGANLQNQYKEVTKTRVNDTDKAILDIKARLKQLKTYTEKLELQSKQQQDKIQEHLKEKSKQRALIALKHKKFLEKQIEKSLGAQTLLQQTVQNIESAAIDADVYQALKKGDEVITDLKSKASLEDFEELYEKHQDNLERQKMEQELFGQVLNDEELDDELAKLDAMILEDELPAAGSAQLEYQQQQQQQQYQEEDNQYDQQQVRQKPQLIAA